ncbi:hypothetical protein DFR37_11425 [Eoetvoesiella caeni]|uniref:Uncharacterized protein n=1 Tax=Eoetvoesiella caeni TaxID=645616 RepID=A0A366H242_9BURK|nr:hypothetical protein DFR37_11425 [Eoetvoesiella caeni]
MQKAWPLIGPSLSLYVRMLGEALNKSPQRLLTARLIQNFPGRRIGMGQVLAGCTLQRWRFAYLLREFRALIRPSMPFWLICSANWLR